MSPLSDWRAATRPAARASDRPLPASAPGQTWLHPQDITECAACTLDHSPRNARSWKPAILLQRAGFDEKRGETVAGQRPPCAFLSQPRVPGNAALALDGPRDTKHDRSAPVQSAHPTGKNKLSLRFRWFAIRLQVSETNLLRKL